MRAELNASAGVTASFRYRAYGAIAQSNGATTPSYLGYAGQLLDPSGSYYMRARWYDPGTGRWASRDPVAGDPATLNGFGYAAANPLLADPGLWTFGICVAVTGAIGALAGYQVCPIIRKQCRLRSQLHEDCGSSSTASVPVAM